MNPNSIPAFPSPGLQWASDARFEDRDGMTLRDYFAGQALIRITGADPDGVHGPDILAKCCYALADAMLKAREEA